MIIKLLKADRMKLKRSPVWLAFLIMPIIPAVLGTLNYSNNLDLLKSEWYSLWTQHTLFTCYFFLPVLIGVYCAYIMRIEQTNHNWNKVLTMPVHRASVFISKIITASGMVLISQIWIAALFIISGKLVGMTAAPPYSQIAVWCCLGTLGGIVTAAIQLIISFFIKSFALPVGISFAGGLSGLVFLSKGYGHIWPYSLMAYGMNSNNNVQQIQNSKYAGFAAVCIVYILVSAFIGAYFMSKRDM